MYALFQWHQDQAALSSSWIASKTAWASSDGATQRVLYVSSQGEPIYFKYQWLHRCNPLKKKSIQVTSVNQATGTLIHEMTKRTKSTAWDVQ